MINKNIISLSLIMVCNIEADSPRAIRLENYILSKIDGSFVNGDNIALTKKYQSNILDIILGKKTREGRLGSYEFEGKLYSAQELCKIEEQLGNTISSTQKQQLKTTLRKMRDDFERISESFKELARASRDMIAELISESCKKRNRSENSLILIWARSKENEYVLFDRHVTQVKDFVIFMTDLYNFLGDLVNSCPIAQRQFKERVEKFNKIRQLLPALSLSPEQQQQFLKEVQKRLNSITLAQIDAEKVKALYNASKH